MNCHEAKQREAVECSQLKNQCWTGCKLAFTGGLQLADVTVYFHGSELLWNTGVFECTLVNNIQE